MALQTVVGVSAIIGIASHVAYFNRGEHHLWTQTYLKIFFLSLVGAVAALTHFNGLSVASALGLSVQVASSYLAGVFASLLVYRFFLSPLNKFPGPWQAKISDLWYFNHLDQCSAYYQHEQMHRKYGKYVRVGSNVLSITDADLHEVAFGPGTKVRKAEWYDGSTPYISLQTTRDRALHDRRRRMWAPAFSDKALRAYEPHVTRFNDKFVQRLREHHDGPVNVSKWFSLYAFDVMGRLAFGKDYDMLDSGERHWALQLLTDGMGAVGPRPPTWFFRLLISIPFAASGFHKFMQFCRDELEWRLSQEDSEGDITGWLVKAYKGISRPIDDPMLQADSRLIIVAGSDTSAATFTYLFYELAKKPEEARKLRKELQALAKADWTHADIRNADHLNGCINESLRLHPPVPSGLQRITPPEGCQVGDVFIPGNVSFWMPQYAIGRDEEYYENALDFVPERWYSKPDMIKHKNAFAPFSLGGENCIGKNLAMLEMRTLVAQIVLNFDFAFAPGEDGQRLLHKTKEHFTLSLGQLDLTFTPLAA